ncbi:unnamed protein product [Closterium sp. NIES-54]
MSLQYQPERLLHKCRQHLLPPQASSDFEPPSPALQPTAPNHPGEPPPLPPCPGPPPPEPNLTVAATPELQAAADTTFLHNCREYLIRKADHDVAEYFSITLATCDGAVDYVGRMQEVADRLAARQAALSEPLQIHRLLFNLTPDYESCLHTFTEANPLAGLPEVTQWIIDTEVKLRTPIVNLTTTHSSSTSLNATQPRTQGGRNGGGGGRGGGGGSSRGSGRGARTFAAMVPTPCGQTNHPPAACFKALDDTWFVHGNTGTPPCWNSVTPRPSLVDIQTLPSFLPAHLRLLTPSPPSQAAAVSAAPAAATAAAFSAAAAPTAAVLPAAAAAAIDDAMPSSSNATTPISTSFPTSGRESDRPAVSVATTTTLRANPVLPDRASLKAKYRQWKLNFARPAGPTMLAPTETIPPATHQSADDDDDEDEEKDVSGKRRQLSVEELQLKCMEQWLRYFPWLYISETKDSRPCMRCSVCMVFGDPHNKYGRYGEGGIDIQKQTMRKHHRSIKHEAAVREKEQRYGLKKGQKSIIEFDEGDDDGK